MTGPDHIKAVANVFLFDLNDALSTTGALAWSRGILLEGRVRPCSGSTTRIPWMGRRRVIWLFLTGGWHNSTSSNGNRLGRWITPPCAALLERLDAANNQDIRGALGHIRQMIRQLTSGDTGENSATSDVAARYPLRADTRHRPQGC